MHAETFDDNKRANMRASNNKDAGMGPATASMRASKSNTHAGMGPATANTRARFHREQRASF